MPALGLPNFVAKWRASTRTERAAAQEHFIDLCRLLGQPTPNEADPTGAFYAFEKGVTHTGGGKSFADAWKRGHFAWEYKGQHGNLVAAYRQLLRYRDDLRNPPLLVVCDLDWFEVHTNFTDTAKRVYVFALADLGTPAATPTSALPPLEVLGRRGPPHAGGRWARARPARCPNLPAYAVAKPVGAARTAVAPRRVNGSD